MPVLRVEEAGPVARVILAREAVHNALNPELIGELEAAFRSLATGPARVVVLAAEGKSFCAGADLKWMREAGSYTFEENVADARAVSQMLRAIDVCPLPVIARVHGAAFGGGVGLVSACDLSVAVQSATFSLSEVKLGLIPSVISPFVLRKIGPAAARRYFLTGERFPAAAAHRIGLLSEVVETEAELDAQVERWAAGLLENAPGAMAACKQLIREVAAAGADTTELTAQRIAERRASAEGQEGMQAFLDKRPPSWRIAPE